jgi:hypothetical protein
MYQHDISEKILARHLGEVVEVYIHNNFKGIYIQLNMKSYIFILFSSY